MKSKWLIIMPVVLLLLVGACKKYATGMAPAANSISAAGMSTPMLIATAGVWRRIADYGGIGRYHAFSFIAKKRAYVGGGDIDDYSSSVSDFWSYNPTTQAWTQKANLPGGPRVGAAAFAIADKGYISTGFTPHTIHLNFLNKTDTWMYDPDSNTWTRKADFPGTPRGGAAGMTINNKGYVGIGVFHENAPSLRDNALADWWQYDPLTNTWTKKASFPGAARCYAAGAALATEGYLGLGASSVIGPSLTNYTDWYKYDAITNAWSYRGVVPFTARNSAVAMAVQNTVYVGTGSTDYPVNRGNPTVNTQDMWSYQSSGSTGTWSRIAYFPVLKSGAVGFSIADTIYAGTGYNTDFYALSTR